LFNKKIILFNEERENAGGCGDDLEGFVLLKFVV